METESWSFGGEEDFPAGSSGSSGSSGAFPKSGRDAYGGKDYVVHQAQTFVISPETANSPAVPTMVASIDSLRKIIADWLFNQQCFLIHFGNSDVEFSCLAHMCNQLREERGVPVSCCCPGMDPDKAPCRLLNPHDIPKAFVGEDRESILYHYIRQSDAIDIGKIFTRICELARSQRENKIDLSQVRLGIIIDREGGNGITKRIMDTSTDQHYFSPDFEADRVRPLLGEVADCKLMSSYRPQVTSVDSTKPTVLQKDWEANAIGHHFRNSMSPPILDPLCTSPLGGLKALLSHSPFGLSGLVAVAVLSDRGEELRHLLEYWLNQCIGTPTKWISLD